MSGNLKRKIGIVILYAVLGPPIGMLGIMLVGASVNAIEKGQYTQILMAPLLVFSPLVLFSYLFGGVPALVTGFVTLALDYDDSLWKRVLIAGCVGAAISLFWQFVFLGGAGRQDPLMFPLVGAFSATVCMLLSAVLLPRHEKSPESDEKKRSH